MTATELTLVRHGRTAWYAENRYAGRTDLELDGVGLAQAESLAGWARTEPPDLLACSPLRRARDTAAPVAAALALHAEVVDELREVDFGVAEGLTLDELRRRDPAAAEAFTARAEPFPGGEAPEPAAARVLGALRGLAARHPGARILVVGHNTALRLALCAWLGIPARYYRDVLPGLENVARTRLRVPDDPARPPALLGLNLPTGPAGAPPEPLLSTDPRDLVRTTRRTP
jgi:probable phosphoglycerate mutase